MLKPTDKLIFKDKCEISGRNVNEHIGGLESDLLRRLNPQLEGEGSIGK